MIIAAFQEYLEMIEAEDKVDANAPLNLSASSYECSDMEPPIAARQSEHELASDFMFRLLRQPHIERPGGEIYETTVGVVSAFITPPDEEQNVFVQHAVIATDYGCIYMHTALDDDGGVPENTAGVYVDFDNEALQQIVVGLAAGDPVFRGLPTPAFNYINSIDEMEFLLGNQIRGIQSITTRIQ